MLRAEDIYKCVKPNLWKHVTKAVAARAGAAGHSPEASELRLRAGEAAGECGGAPGLESMPKAGHCDSIPKGFAGLPGRRMGCGLPGSRMGSMLQLLGSMLLLL